jgi:hypothetical protein
MTWWEPQVPPHSVSRHSRTIGPGWDSASAWLETTRTTSCSACLMQLPVVNFGIYGAIEFRPTHIHLRLLVHTAELSPLSSYTGLCSSLNKATSIVNTRAIRQKQAWVSTACLVGLTFSML